VNAFTSYHETAYYFSTTNHLLKPLSLLLDMVNDVSITTKKISLQLKERYEKRMQLLSKPPTTFETHHQNLKQQNPNDLLKAFEKVMARLRLSNPYEMKTTNKELSVSERVNQLRREINQLDTIFSLEELLFTYKDIQEMIVTFLAILDMIRLHELSFHIDEETVYLQRRMHE